MFYCFPEYIFLTYQGIILLENALSMKIIIPMIEMMIIYLI